MANGKGTITVIVDTLANVEISVTGAPGKSCQSLTAALEKALGTPSTSKRTQQYYERDERQTLKN